MFEKTVPRIIFGPKREEVMEWRKLHNEELHNLYSSPNQIVFGKSRSVTLVGHVACRVRREMPT
jgi:hypothetical protein